jgi:hypothetical protein
MKLCCGLLLLLASANALPADPPLVRLEPAVLTIPADQLPQATWPDYESSERCGHTSLEVHYEFGSDGWRAGEELLFGFGYPSADVGNSRIAQGGGYIFGPSRRLRRFPLGQPQVSDPKQHDYVSAHCSRSAVDLEVSIEQQLMALKGMVRVIPQGDLLAGERITVRFGDQSQGSPGATLSWHPGSPQAVVLRRGRGEGSYVTAAGSYPTLLVTGATATGFVVNVPATPRVGEPVSFRVQAVQGVDLTPTSNVLPVENFTGNIELSTTDEKAELDSMACFEPEHRGTLHLTVTFHTPGTHVVHVRRKDPEGDPVEAYSNAVWVGEQWQRLCGDLQRHSAQGGHAGLTDTLCWQQLFDRGDDFGAVLHHVAGAFAGFRHTNAVCRSFQKDVDPDEKRFVAFPAFEWSHSGDHRHIVFQRPTDEIAFTDRPYRGVEEPAPHKAYELKDLLERVRSPAKSEVPRLAIPHHTLWTRPDWPRGAYPWGPRKDDPAQPLVEIYSWHGSSEKLTGQDDSTGYLMKGDPKQQHRPPAKASVQDALALGYRFGLIGGSDHHGYALQQVEQEPDGSISYGRSGLAFVLGDRNTPALRDRIYDALATRRTYATTGARILLSFEAVDANGTRTVMGEAKAMRDPVEFRVRAAASGLGRPERARFTRLSIYKDGTELVHEERWDGELEVNLTWRESATPGEAAQHCYYVRVQQDDLHLAWSSPIWCLNPKGE